MLLLEPWLTNVQATELPKPYVKWSYETVRAEDATAALMRAYAEAIQPPMGPVFLSLPMDGWDKLIEYEGAPHGLFATHKERLTGDLLSFLRG